MRTPTGTTQCRQATTLERGLFKSFPDILRILGRESPPWLLQSWLCFPLLCLVAQGAWGKERKCILPKIHPRGTQGAEDRGYTGSLHKDSYFSLPGLGTTSQSLELRWEEVE